MYIIHHQHAHYTKTYHGESSISIEQFGAKAGTWLAELFSFIAARSRLNPIPTSEWNPLCSVVALVQDDLLWRRLANTPLKDLTLDIVVKGVAAFELESEKHHSVSESAKRLASASLCKWTVRLGEAHGIARLNTLQRYRKTLFPRAVSKGRGMISDLVDESAPVGAMNFENIANLKKEVGKKIDRSLTRVFDACDNEFQSIEANADKFRHIVKDKGSAQLFHKLADVVIDKRVSNQARDFPWLGNLEQFELLAGYYALMKMQENRVSLVRYEEQHYNIESRPLQFGAVRGRELCDVLSKNFGLEVAGLMDLQVAIFNVLNGGFSGSVASALAIQAFTGWNIKSVLSLDDDKFEEVNNAIVIQGFKSKTGELTPYVYIGSSEKTVMKAISFLRGRLRALKSMGWVSGKSNDLWLRPVSPGKPLRQWIAWGFGLNTFCKKHSLPIFSFEMVRNEVLVKIANEKGGIEAARQVGGHSNITTTGSYVDQMINHRKNSAVSLMFQRELQASVQYDFDDSYPKDFKRGYLLAPIGDGSSCNNPARPPDPNQLEFGICDAKRCHIESGCPNRRIVIDDQRLEELVRFSIHFKETWQRKLQSNPDQFDAVHLPAWSFNQALMGVIERGAYRHRLKDMQLRIGDGNRT